MEEITTSKFSFVDPCVLGGKTSFTESTEGLVAQGYSFVNPVSLVVKGFSVSAHRGAALGAKAHALTIRASSARMIKAISNGQR